MRATPEAKALLEHEAEVRAQMTTYRELAIKTGLAEQYIANFVGRLIRAKRQKVDVSLKPRRFTRLTTQDIEALAKKFESNC